MEDDNKMGDVAVAEHFIKSFSATLREPFLIIKPDLKIYDVNDTFLKTFSVKREDTKGKFIYNIGNKQWDIPELRELLENILPEKKVINDFQVTHTFPDIGEKTMLLNARKFDDSKMIIVAIEDVSLQHAIEKKLANYTKSLEEGIAEKTEELQIRIDELARLNDVMVGREMKMIDLKEEIAQLKKEKKDS